MKNLIQVAGIIDKGEAELMVECGVDWLGFPLRLPSGKNDISEDDARTIIGNLPTDRAGVPISYLTVATEVAEFCDELGCSIVQLHGDVTPDELAALQQLRPNLQVLKSLVVRGDNLAELLAQVDESQEFVDMFITDTFDPSTGAKGATGKTHDWPVSAELAARSVKPLMLAGGLTPENVANAVRVVRPAAVDAHTALEGADGRKDRDKVVRFVQEAPDAFAKF